MILLSNNAKGTVIARLLTNGSDYKLEVNGVQEIASFTLGSGLGTSGTLSNKIMFAIPAGYTVDEIKMYRAGALIGTIALQGDEIITFQNNGTYVIDSMIIAFAS